MQGYVELTRITKLPSGKYISVGGRMLFPVGGFAVCEGATDVWIKTGPTFDDGFYCHESFDEVKSLIEAAQVSGECVGDAITERDWEASK